MLHVSEMIRQSRMVHASSRKSLYNYRQLIGGQALWPVSVKVMNRRPVVL